MKTRSSRYLDEDVSTKPKSSRASKNRYLYDEVNNRIGYGKIDNFASIDQEINNFSKTRDDYRQRRENQNNRDESDDLLKKEPEERIYDINSVLEEAKKNRNISEEMEKKQKLQNVEYNILSDLNKKYASKKEKEELEKEGIKELIDTITSKSLPKELADAQDDGKDLMSDLMATNTMNAITNINDVNLEEEIAKEILAEKNEQTEENDEIKKENGRLVNSFYTRSMDLTEHDFNFSDDSPENKKAKKKIIILIILILIVIILIAVLFALKKLNIV